MPGDIEVNIAVEGDIDEAVAHRLLRDEDLIVGPSYGKKGKSFLRTRIGGYNNSARFSPWLLIADLNGQPCPAGLVRDWLPNPSLHMCFRVAVREIEAWLIADRNGIADFLSVPVSVIQADPEALNDPKAAVVNLARRSRKREIREGMVPKPQSGRQIGAAYSSYLIEFTTRHWAPAKAAESSPSLRRALSRIKRFAAEGTW